MFEFYNNHIFTGYLKQLLANVNIPTCKIYTREFDKYLKLHGKEDPRVLESFDTLSTSRLSTRINYIKNNEIYNYYWDTSETELNNTKKWVKSNMLSYDKDKTVFGLTKKLNSQGNYYDTETHEYLGEYLRFLRDYHNINLMSMYNCFNNKLCNNLNYTFVLNPLAARDDQIKTTFYSQDSKYKIYAIPVKLFANYTIAIDCNNGVEMFCAFYNNKLINSKRSQDLIARTYKKVDKTIFNQPFLYDKLDFRYWSFETDTSKQDYNRTQEKTLLIPEKITRWDIANNEKDLKLFIKVPTSCKSSIVILEGDYRTYNNCRYFPPGKFKLDGTIFDESVDDDNLLHTTRQTWELRQNNCVVNFGNNEDIVKVDVNDDFKPIGKLQLLSFNTGESYPFADRLVEYLVGSAITSIDEIPDNIKRAQAVMNQNNIYFRIAGLWENKMQKVIYDYINNTGYHTKLGHTSNSTLYDVLGYIDSDAEKWYASTELENNKVKVNTIQNIDIYNNLFNL